MTPPTYNRADCTTMIRELADAELQLDSIRAHACACELAAIADELETAVACVQRASNRAIEARSALIPRR